MMRLKLGLFLFILNSLESTESKDIWLDQFRRAFYIWTVGPQKGSVCTPPFCAVSSSHCNLFDLDYVTSDNTGDGYRCWTGSKVLCRTRNLSTTTVVSRPNKLTVLTYEVDNVPHVVKHHGQRERSCHIPRAIATKLPAVDVIIIQGSFTAGCWHRLTMLDLFRIYGFLHQTSIVGEPPSFPKVVNGGVLIVSRWPIRKSSSLVFNSYNTKHADHLISKGAAYAAINKQGVVHHVFGTDLQGGAGRYNQDTRISQAYELRDFINGERIPTTELVIIAGYFHADYLDCPGKVNDILRVLNAHLPIMRKGGEFPDGTMSPKENNLAVMGLSTEWLDYITYSKQHRQPTNATMSAVKLITDKRFPYCKLGLQPFYVYPDEKLCLVSDTTHNLSDHFPVISEIQL